MVRKALFVLVVSGVLIVSAFYFGNRQKPSLKITENITTSSKEIKKEVFAKNLGRVRDLEFSPNGTLLASVTSAGKIVALPVNKPVLENLDRPHGIAFFDNKLFVAEETKLSRYTWEEQNQKATLDKVLFDLPQGGRHFTRSIVFDKNGKLYISIGSTCDVCNENHPWLGSVIVTDANGNNPEVFVSGLRNSVFLTVNPNTNEVWATEMGRDFLGDNLPPDEINILRSGTNYGWPNCYGDKIPDTRFNPNASCENTQSPIFKIAAHSAPLGLTFAPDSNLLVAYHGSWNRSIPVGYKIVKLSVNGNTITKEEDFVSGGRPVDVIFDKTGNLYYSDDKAGAVYKVDKK